MKDSKDTRRRTMCVACGACCTMKKAPDGVPYRFSPDGFGRVRCEKLDGIVGTNARCSVYNDRPLVCRLMPFGCGDCDAAREAHGLPIVPDAICESFVEFIDRKFKNVNPDHAFPWLVAAASYELFNGLDCARIQGPFCGISMFDAIAPILDAASRLLPGKDGEIRAPLRRSVRRDRPTPEKPPRES